MHYIAPFETVRSVLTISKSREEETVTKPYEHFLGALRLLLAGIDVDEDWYLAQNPDIAEAIIEPEQPRPPSDILSSTGISKDAFHFVSPWMSDGICSRTRMSPRTSARELWCLRSDTSS